MRKIAKLIRSVKAVSPVISVLLMIAIAVVASLVAYAWIMGYIGGTSTKSGNAVQIQSYTSGSDSSPSDNRYMRIYVQNVGQNSEKVDSVYINDALVHITSPTNLTVGKGNTLGLTIDLGTGNSWTSGEQVKIKVVTTDGMFSQISGTGTSGTSGPGSLGSVVSDSFAITAPSGSTGGTVSIGETFTITAQIKLSAGTASVSAQLTAPSGYTVTSPNPLVQSVSTSDVAFAFTVTAPSSASAVASMTLSASAAGYSTAQGSTTVTTVAGALLTGSFTAPATSNVNVGGTINVDLKVTNSGSDSATAVAPATLTLAGTGSANLASGPSPASATIAAGTSQDFTWTYTASSAGTVTFSGSATGTDQYSGSAITTGTVGPSNTVTVQPITYKVTFDTNGGDSGVSVSPGTGNYPAGPLLISATGDAGYMFKSWTVSGFVTVDSATSPQTTAHVTGTGTVTANFQNIPFGQDGAAVTGINIQNQIVISVTTNYPNDIIHLSISENYGANVLGISSTPTLSWAQRSHVAYSNGGNQQLETWWARVATAGTYQITITFYMPVGSTNAAVVACAISGAKSTGSPFDGNSAVPKSNSGGNGYSGSATISTSNANDLIIGSLAIERGSFSNLQPGTNFNIVGSKSSNGNSVASEYQIVSSQKSNFAVGFSWSNQGDWAVIADAIQQGP